jgi:Flp pilus assembly protein TadG
MQRSRLNRRAGPRGSLTGVLDRVFHPRNHRGQALVELALIVPIMLLLFLATIDLGRLYYSTITVSNAAREAALEATVHPTSYIAGTCDPDTSSIVCAAVNEAASSWVTVAPGDVALTCTPSCSEDYGNTVNVTVTGNFKLLTPLISGFTGGSNVTLTATAKGEVIEVPAPVTTATPTPTPTPTPDPSATPTPTPDPGPTPTPTPVPTPACSPPFAGFTYTQQNKNKPVVFTSTSMPTTGSCAIISWRWVFGDTAISEGNLPTVSHTYATKGATYVVTLTVTNPEGTTTTTFMNVTTLS